MEDVLDTVWLNTDAGVDDIDLNLEDFVQRVNSDVVGKVVNIASRCAGFLRKGFANRTADSCSEPELLNTFIDAGDDIAKARLNYVFDESAT